MILHLLDRRLCTHSRQALGKRQLLSDKLPWWCQIQERVTQKPFSSGTCKLYVFIYFKFKNRNSGLVLEFYPWKWWLSKKTLMGRPWNEITRLYPLPLSNALNWETPTFLQHGGLHGYLTENAYLLPQKAGVRFTPKKTLFGLTLMHQKWASSPMRLITPSSVNIDYCHGHSYY